MKRASSVHRTLSVLLTVILSLCIIPYATAAQTAASPVYLKDLGSKAVQDVLRADGTLTGQYSSADKLPEGDEMVTLSSYSQFIELLKKQGNIESTRVIITPDAVTDAVPKTDLQTEAAAPAAAQDSGGSGDFSTTNVRTEGVDEPDLIKTDGKYIYYLSTQRYNNAPQSVIIVNADTMEVAARIPASNNVTFKDILLSGNKLVVAASYYSNETRFGGYKQFSIYYIYDISKPESPALYRQLRLGGYPKEMRLMNHTLYLVAGSYIPYVTYQTPLSSVLPLAYDSAVSGDYFALAPQAIRCFPKDRFSSIMTFASLRIDDKKPADIQAALSSGDQIYMSTNALYTIGYDWNEEAKPTRIVRYDAADGKLRYSGGVKVAGRMLNDYSIDEFSGYLRVATTDNNGNHLFVYNSSLQQVGSVENLVKGERIQSVRYMGNAAYIVTYLQRDPLFALDLSSPGKPRVTGQLKIPGFSSYLHPFGSKYLVGIGRETSETFFTQNGKRVSAGNAVDLGLKISLFDVSRPSSPREVAKKIIGSAYTYSDAAYNPRTIMVDTSRSLMAFPIEYNDHNPYASNPDRSKAEQWSGGIVLTITPRGIDIKAKMKDSDLPKLEGVYYSSYESRFCRIGNTLYFAMGNVLRSYDYTTFAPVKQLKLY